MTKRTVAAIWLLFGVICVSAQTSTLTPERLDCLVSQDKGTPETTVESQCGVPDGADAADEHKRLTSYNTYFTDTNEYGIFTRIYIDGRLSTSVATPNVARAIREANAPIGNERIGTAYVTSPITSRASNSPATTRGTGSAVFANLKEFKPTDLVGLLVSIAFGLIVFSCIFCHSLLPHMASISTLDQFFSLMSSLVGL